MTRYADRLLADGEQVVLRSRQHWLAMLIDGRAAVSILLASFVLLGIASFALEQGAARDWLGALAFILLLGAMLVLARLWLSWRSQDYLVTNRRVMKVEGIIRKRSADSSLEKINDAVLEQGVFGRMFGFGNLEILTAAEIAVDRFHMLAQAQTFKRTMLEEKNRLERDVRLPPSPPLRAVPPAPMVPVSVPPEPGSPALAGAGATNGPGAATAATDSAATADAADVDWAAPGAAATEGRGESEPITAPPAVGSGASANDGAATDWPTAAPATGPHSMSSEEITRLLADLADLRDRGAISAEDYEAKKQDLLARL
ncbi:MAG TPA: PH domain-containing protein [Candidatus Eisenbacteria bacterium]|nr:PH domain-containing protein [Candidatus Eisenbacteria bacterium]